MTTPNKIAATEEAGFVISVAKWIADKTGNAVQISLPTAAAAAVLLALAAGQADAQNRPGNGGCNGPQGCGTIDKRTQVRVEGDKTNIAVAPGMGSFSNSCFREIFVSAGVSAFSAGFGVKLDYNKTCARWEVLKANAAGHCVPAMVAGQTALLGFEPGSVKPSELQSLVDGAIYACAQQHGVRLGKPERTQRVRLAPAGS